MEEDKIEADKPQPKFQQIDRQKEPILEALLERALAVEEGSWGLKK